VQTGPGRACAATAGRQCSGGISEPSPLPEWASPASPANAKAVRYLTRVQVKVDVVSDDAIVAYGGDHAVVIALMHPDLDRNARVPGHYFGGRNGADEGCNVDRLPGPSRGPKLAEIHRDSKLFHGHRKNLTRKP
jgi:hypothetical protein